MSRFKHLEFGDAHPEEQAPEDGLIDEITYLARADKAFDDESYERSLAYYSRALQYDRNSTAAWAGQIRCLVEMGELPEAITWSDSALERFPGSAEVLASRAIAEARGGNPTAAVGFADSAMKNSARTALVWVARGEALIGVNLANARACFGKAAEFDPSDASVVASIGRAYMAHRLWRDAYAVLRQHSEAYPDCAMVWFKMGECAAAMRDANEALRCYDRALSLRPDLKAATDARYEVSSRGALGSLIWKLTRRR